MQHAEVGRPSLEDLYELNQAVADSRSLRLLVTNNLATYVTLMERHLDRGVKVAEPELVVALERDLAAMDTESEQSGLQLIKYWASQGWLHRISEPVGDGERNVCYLTYEARAVLDFARRMRREDTIATGGSITGIAAGLRRVAGQVSNDPDRIRADLEHEIDKLRAELDALEEGRRPEPDFVDVEDDARAIALQMEQIISDIGQYGSMLNRITTRLLDASADTDLGYRERQRQLFDDYESLFASRESASYSAFTRMVQDPAQRAGLVADIEMVTGALPSLDPGLREVMSGFFNLVSAQTAEVGRTRQRCARRIKRFVASGTLEQSRGVTRQLNDALASAHELLNVSLVDSRVGMEVPLARADFNSIGAVAFKIRDSIPPTPAESSDGEVNLSAFAALAQQVDAAELAELVNGAVTAAPLSLPDAIGLLDAAYLGHVIVLWSWALRQPCADGAESVRVRFQSVEGTDREIEVPRLFFTEPIPTASESLL
ncbi:DUF3375 domain-containing protein [Mycobacterium sp. 21AC1]|uniref:DUF3375 domain-containing protein n=1 Tax=[Mycobacterium] appelbergii TaxID=2939269 RepID=UPI002938DD75|nr:DUF3375 domain-containing protein [Mycobacterium sp. 21AC1]MDV3128627.1 DUF3375 domain-containing protein [Mycobacterium sp. 21AC1]